MTNPLVEHFRMLTSYNTLANRRLHEACSQLSDREYRASREAFFGSIYATLNHLVVGDRIWLARFGGEEVPSTNLDAILYEDFTELRRAREAEDDRIETFVSTLDAAFLDRSIRYTNNEGRIVEDPIVLLVAHFFNHQTHHRGQVHDMLSQTDVAPPVLDLHRVLRP